MCIPGKSDPLRGSVPAPRRRSVVSRWPARLRRRLVLLLVGILVPLQGIAAAEIRLEPRQLTAMGIRFAPVQRDGRPGTADLSVPARVVIPPDRIRVLSAPASGLIQSLRVATQQEVKGGEALGRLAVPAVLEAQRALIQAVSQARMAEEVAQRDEALLADGIIPAARAHASRAQSVEAQAVRREREQSLLMLGVSRQDLDGLLAGEIRPAEIALLAPGAGTVIEVSAAVGQRVEAGTALARIARLDRLWLELQVPVASAGTYHVGDRLMVDGLALPARVINVGRLVQTESQVVEVRAEVSGNPALRAGAVVGVRVQREAVAGRERWQLPASAVVAGPAGPQVFVQTPHGVRPVPLKRVGDTPEGPVVEGELKPGDQIAVSGVAALRAAENVTPEGR